MFVLQPWLANVGLKQQSILISGLRAPDAKTDYVKRCVRWLRSHCQVDADPAKQSYMQTIVMCPDLMNRAMDELEYLPCHYVHHFADAFAVAAHNHPEQEVQIWAWMIHNLVAEEIFHFRPETKGEFFERHKDKPGAPVIMTIVGGCLTCGCRAVDGICQNYGCEHA